jgi:hypothetical protein
VIKARHYLDTRKDPLPWLFVADRKCFVAIDVPHAPRNESGKPCTWIVVHSSGSDQYGIVLLPELDVKLAQRLGATA